MRYGNGPGKAGPFLLGGAVADGLYIMPVRVEHEGAVIIFVIIRAQAGLAIIGAAGGEGCGVESVDRGAVGGGEGDVGAGDGGGVGADPELAPIQKKALGATP